MSVKITTDCLNLAHLMLLSCMVQILILQGHGSEKRDAIRLLVSKMDFIMLILFWVILGLRMTCQTGPQTILMGTLLIRKRCAIILLEKCQVMTYPDVMELALLVHTQFKDATIMTILKVLHMLDARSGTLTPLLSKLMPQIQLF